MFAETAPEIAPAEGGCKRFMVIQWPCWAVRTGVHVSTVSFYSWESRTCYLFRGDAATTPLLVLPPARTLWAVHGRHQVIHPRKASRGHPSSHCRAERLRSRLCNATTERASEQETESGRQKLLQAEADVLIIQRRGVLDNLVIRVYYITKRAAKSQELILQI